MLRRKELPSSNSEPGLILTPFFWSKGLILTLLFLSKLILTLKLLMLVPYPFYPGKSLDEFPIVAFFFFQVLNRGFFSWKNGLKRGWSPKPRLTTTRPSGPKHRGLHKMISTTLTKKKLSTTSLFQCFVEKYV